MAACGLCRVHAQLQRQGAPRHARYTPWPHACLVQATWPHCMPRYRPWPHCMPRYMPHGHIACLGISPIIVRTSGQNCQPARRFFYVCFSTYHPFGRPQADVLATDRPQGGAPLCSGPSFSAYTKMSGHGGMFSCWSAYRWATISFCIYLFLDTGYPFKFFAPPEGELVLKNMNDTCALPR